MADADHVHVEACWRRNADAWIVGRSQRPGRLSPAVYIPRLHGRLPSVDGLDVVEFGCGEGAVTRSLASMGVRSLESISPNG